MSEAETNENASASIASEQVEVCLNFEGEDYTVIVPLETANILLNDPEEADIFVRRNLNRNMVEVPESTHTENNEECEQPPDESTPTENSDECEEPPDEAKLVWSSRKPTTRDNEATEFFLQLRDKYSASFNDRKTQKCQIWQKIVKEMNSAGYSVGEGKGAIEKVRLKFANLQKQYLAYMKHVNTTGEKKKDPPLFYTLLHGILGGKDKVNPCRVEDTEDRSTSSTSSTGTDSNETPPTPAEIKSRFKRVAEVKPKTVTTQLLEFMKQQNEIDRKERQEQFSKLENILEKQNQQKDEFLSAFKQLVELKSQKKRRHSSSSDD